MNLDDLATLRYEREGHVATLTLNRPDRLNAMTGELWAELRGVGEALRDESELRTLVVIGEGRAFSSGIDTSVFAEGFGDAVSEQGSQQGSSGASKLVDTIMTTQDSFTWLAEAPFATIAAVRGYAYGAGLQLALACDLRILARGSKVGLLEFQYGMMPDLGGTQRLPRLVGPGKAKELIFTRARIDAEEAYRIGIAERLVDDDVLEKEAASLAAEIAAQPPLAVRGVKDAVEAALTLEHRDGLRVEAERQSVCLSSADLLEAMQAFVEQRDPEYRGE